MTTPNTIKFSQFAQMSYSNSTNRIVGTNAATGGSNIITPFPAIWDTASRPMSPTLGTFGFNTSFNQYEYWNGSAWVQLASGGSGTVASGTALAIGYYATAGTTISPITTANSSVFVTSNVGVPSWSTTLPAGLTIPGYAHSGANADITSLNALTGILKAPTAIQSASNENVLQFAYAASAVNWILLGNNAAGLPPVINAVGSDTNIDLNLGGKGNGAVNILGTSTNSNAPTGYVGEYKENARLLASSIPLTNGVAADVTSLLISAGDWDVWGTVLSNNSGNATTSTFIWINNVSATPPDQAFLTGIGGGAVAGTDFAGPAVQRRFSVTAPTTIYLSVASTFSGGTQKACGGIFARRVR